MLVIGQTSITLEASIGFSILKICHGVAQDFFICLVAIFTPSSKILFSSLKTFNTFASLFLSIFFQDIIFTLSQILIFIRILLLIIKLLVLNLLFFGIIYFLILLPQVKKFLFLLDFHLLLLLHKHYHQILHRFHLVFLFLLLFLQQLLLLLFSFLYFHLEELF